MQIANGRRPENNGEIYNACTVYKQTTHYTVVLVAYI